MSKKIYVGNLSFEATESDLRELFQSHGAISSVKVAVDRMTGQSRGFGFVEMAEGADEAIAALDGAALKGRNLRVNEARPPENRGGFRR
ncbi:MAG TPA: RNA-binding protein [Planctomycetia bacterium]|nr:RNA-binding protein [Planctomycetia bacterium]